MLITMLTLFTLGGGLMGGMLLNPAEVEAIRERLELAVEDPARSTQAGEIVDELKTEIETFDRIFVESGEDLEGIYLDHSAGRYKMLQTLEKLNLEWYASQSRGMKLRQRLRETLSADEWNAIFDAGQSSLSGLPLDLRGSPGSAAGDVGVHRPKLLDFMLLNSAC